MRRRRFLALTSSIVASPLTGLDRIVSARRAPAMIPRALSEWPLPSGVQVGDVTDARAMIWSAAGREAAMRVEVSRDERFTTTRLIEGPAALESSGHTAALDLGGLSAGEPVFYRVWFEDLRDGSRSARVEGRFRTAPVAARPFTVCWSGDVVGQGWGIDRSRGGLRLYETMARHEPDVFVHSGDQIYADNPLRTEVTLEDGTIWRNVVTPAKSKVAETLDEFRGNYAYNLLDDHARMFNSQVPMIVQWDDHEVLNNWNPGTDLGARPEYREKSIATLSARARRAMFDYLPIRPNPDEPGRVYRGYRYGPLVEIFLLDQRSYRAANSANRQDVPGPDTQMMGQPQLDWLKRALGQSRATWKVMASDMPLGLVIGDGREDGVPRFEGWANGPGGPLGREHELADLLSFLKAGRIRNVVWITADVHYAAAHRYDPAAAVFKNFDPFWEFVAGPLHAGTFGPGVADPTFGCTQVFSSVPAGMKPNRPPSDGRQFFGTLTVDPRSRSLTAALWNLANEKLWSVVLDAAG
jgi:alkaline phosphatase D